MDAVLTTVFIFYGICAVATGITMFCLWLEDIPRKRRWLDDYAAALFMAFLFGVPWPYTLWRILRS